MKYIVILALLCVFELSNSFTVTTKPVTSRTVLMSSSLSSPPPTPVENVVILEDADSVGNHIREIVSQAANRAIQERGYFSIAIPGGSILKMLAGDIPNKEEWTSKTTLAYVNHKCVSMDDEQLATHAKACKLFLNEWDGVNAIVLDGTADGEQEAKTYEEKIRSIGDDVLPKSTDSGLPIFDLALIGVGDDGHVGSLYPGREEVLVGNEGSWVLPVNMKEPPSITLSLPLMANAREVVVAACGVSDKYPQGKSEGMKRAVSADGETLTTFPAVGLRDTATWVMDQAAASKLGDAYNQN